MIKIEKTDVYGWDAAIRGMRNPMNSWDKSDSTFEEVFETYDFQDFYTKSFTAGENDLGLMMKLSKGGPVHAKFRRMITVTVDITAPLYWWKEFDTYKVGTVANSCSTMHKIHAKEFTLDDFSHEQLLNKERDLLEDIIELLNENIRYFLNFKDKCYWWQMIQLLPSSYNQKRTVQLNYEVLHNIYTWRKDHKLDEWHVFCDWIQTLPYSEIITGVCGVWIIDPDGYYPYCNQCGYEPPRPLQNDDNRTPYCPSCGAKMRKGYEG